MIGGISVFHKRLIHNRNALWQIVDGRCRVDHLHAPCTEYDAQQGFALLKDIKGRGQYLLIPTQKTLGIEAASLLKPDTPNYFLQAWLKRSYVEKRYGFKIPDQDLALAINSISGRSQDQLHIHIDCLTAYTRAKLDQNMFGSEWSDISLYGHLYRAKRISSLTPSPFQDLAEPEDMGKHTLVVTPAAQGGFILLDDQARALDWGAGEELQDHQCRLDNPKYQRTSGNGRL
ncbi:CDP-diacylglycerol diphosphatase [Swingsia samuiensis]|uniref:CDP-diacylglycerol pyrophosphatase n=2 Tax=Swingsia samuiensis TaxID=1293412 RepID=A0A4Y6UKC9_9PROT|nr:CDP-diacylglycerol diphosphatase [Swingsia samuiensis]